ncbi:hypothetical protein SCP_0201220 [Sparassis crispa]|uniref:Uncharacterized protein n=1 Tax=Sparassis crispa TaxID=139825 RepID=A0A401G9T1_9APHY|nr:hypothetical protein SCP_0201220 [Sparassis crispa]GBE78925.1 hypothetical protein SCP_0201220 [Sparassis crispa]
MASAFDILGLVFGILGFLSSVPVFYAIILSQLPSQKLKELDEVLLETETMWRRSLREGLFAGKPFERKTSLSLYSLRNQTESLRLQAHCATSLLQECKAMLRGLSWSISYVCMESKGARAEISSTTAEERKRLQVKAKLEESLRETAQIQPEMPMASDTSDKYSKQHLYTDEHAADKLFLSPSPTFGKASATLKMDSDKTPWEARVVTWNSPHSTTTFPTHSHFPSGAAPCALITSTAAVSACTSTSDKVTHRQRSKTHTSSSHTASSESVDVIAPQKVTHHPSNANTSICRSTASPVSLPSPAAQGGKFVVPLPSSNTALLQHFHEVKQEMLTRGLAFYTCTSVNAIRMVPWKKHSASARSGECVAGRSITDADMQVLSCTEGDCGVEAFKIRECTDEGLLCIVEARDVSGLV